MSIKICFVAALTTLVCVAPMLAQSDWKSPNIANAAAVTPAPKQDNVSHIPPIMHAKSTGVSKVDGATEIQRPIPLGQTQQARVSAMTKGEIASNGDVCFTLRERRFRAESPNANMPTPYESATCTPSSALHKKSATVELVK